MKKFVMIFAIAAAACGDVGGHEDFADPRIDWLYETCQCEYSVESQAYDLDGNRLQAHDFVTTWEPVEVLRLDCGVGGAVSTRRELVLSGEDVITVNYSEFQKGTCK